MLLLHKPTDICARAMPRVKKGQQKVPILKKTAWHGFATLEVIILCMATWINNVLVRIG